MKNLIILFSPCLIFLSLLMAPTSSSQEKKADPVVNKVYPTGHIPLPPEVRKALRAAAIARHGEHWKKLAVVTAATWDSRTLGLICPVWDQGQCFPAGTMILLPEGEYQDAGWKRIEDVKEGDWVVSGEGRACRVTQTFKRAVDEDIVVMKAISSTKSSAAYVQLRMTKDHPILTPTGYVKGGELTTDDSVRMRWRIGAKDYNDGAIKTLYRERFTGFVYNINVSKDHSYVANGVCVKNCGSCWDFSGTFVADVALVKAGAIKADGSQDLSPQYTLDCYGNGGCNGDDNTTVLTHAKSTGLPMASTYGPYQGRRERCNSSPGTLYKIADWGYAGSQEGVGAVQDIKNAIAQYGCVGCAIAADNAFMNVAPGTVFRGSGSTGINHDVALIGWDDAKGASVGAPTAWLLRNSWGTSFADGGYCWIASTANMVGTEPVWASATPIIPPTPVPPTPGPNPPAPPIPGTPPSISSSLTASGVVGTAFTYQMVAAGATQFSAAGMPTGLRVLSSGEISGTPTLAGTYSITMLAGNTYGASTAVLSLSVTTTPASVVSITLTAQQIQTVLSSANAIPIEDMKRMTIKDYVDRINKCEVAPTGPPPAYCPSCTDADKTRIKFLEGELSDLKVVFAQQQVEMAKQKAVLMDLLIKATAEKMANPTVAPTK